MAGNSSAPYKLVFSSGSPVNDQMKMLLKKAEQFPGHSENRQVQELIKIGKRGVDMLLKAESIEMNVSKDLEIWLEKVNAAISKAGEVLDDCKYEEEPPANDKLRRYLNSTLGRLNTTIRLKSLNSNLRNALKKGDVTISQLLPKGAPDGRSAAAQAKVDSAELESRFVQKSQEDGVKTLVDKLLNSDNGAELSIIVLEGWWETGKTVLAQELYKNGDVMFYYDERMWVQVEEKLDRDALANCMLKALGLLNTTTTAAALEIKLATLQKRLKGKRFLLVLADAGVLDLNATGFPPLKAFLEELGGSRGAKVLVTTGKDPDIRPSFVYSMKLVSADYCQQLFDKISFADGGPIKTSDLEEIGGDLVDICQGNSLYIKLLGCLMYRMKDVSQWQSIYDKLKDSPPGGIAKLCFDYMSSVPLKRCFQYCYFFPEGSLMRREELIELWMAQGYLDLQNRSGPDMEALGRMYYDVLMKSSFFQVSEDDDFDVKSCKIPNVLHCMDLFTESSRKCFNSVRKGDAKDCEGAVHLTLNSCNVKLSKSWKDRFSRLRSLRLHNTEGLADFLGFAQGLRVLIVVDESLEELPESISKLISLRYLDISETRIVKLPDSISELRKLQTLRLYDLKYFPKKFKKLMVSMMHLYIHKLEDFYEMSEWLSDCSKLVYLSSEKGMLKVFVEKEGKLNNVEELHKLSCRFSTISIHCLENANNDASGKITAWLAKIPAGTESLRLNWSVKRANSIDEDVMEKLKPHQSLKHLRLANFKGITFPSWMTSEVDSPISNLVSLEFENCSWCEKLPPLGRLQCLRTLKISGMDNLKSVSNDFYGSEVAFPKLKDFSLRNMSELEAWNGLTPSSRAAFPYLERFEVDQCPKLKGIPNVVLFRKPKCLRKFKVSLCKELTQLPARLRRAKFVEDLELFGLPKLEEFSLGCGSSLKTLVIGCLTDVFERNHLVNKLQELSSLTNLTIWGYGPTGSQENLPHGFANSLTSLQVLKFESCRSLRILPQIMSLKELHIRYCPLLEDSCIRGSRPEWPKVSHIQTIFVDNEIIRQPPNYTMP